MTTIGYREEVFNVLLALLLHERGVVTAPEQSLWNAIERRRRVPDVLVAFRGLRTVIEGKVDDRPDAGRTALRQAQDRVEQGIAHIGLAVLYPASLRQEPFPNLKETLGRSTLQIAVCTEAGQEEWTEGGLDYLSDLLRRTFHHLVEEDVVSKAVDALNVGINQFSESVYTTAVSVEKAANTLGIEPSEGSIKRTTAQDAQVGRLAGLTIANAMIFQEVLSDYEAEVEHLRQTLQTSDAVSTFAEHWDYILTQINYHPIFHAGHELLKALPVNPDVDTAQRGLAAIALGVVSQRAALRHDLMGRIFHRLLLQAKYLGAYYTSVPAATLLLKLAMDPTRWSIDWTDHGEISAIRVADLACGTGTLLMAGAEVITDNYLHARGERRMTPKLDILSRMLMEEILYGYDVLTSALHLTASTLALRSPEVTFKLMHLWQLPFGGQHRRLGSIEFLSTSDVPVTTDLFGGSMMPGQVTSTGDRTGRPAHLPELDICVMNPPFTRSAGKNLLFGSLPPRERRPLQRELAKRLRVQSVRASSVAGLGTVFTAIGDRHLKIGGRLALVLPKTLLSGVAWGKTRGGHVNRCVNKIRRRPPQR